MTDYLATLYSGSSGNSTYIGNAEDGLLVDAGKSCRELCSQLRALDFDLSAVRGLLLTHSHSDHISAVATLHKYYPTLPIYGFVPTLNHLVDNGVVGGDADLRPIDEKGAQVGRFFVTAFDTPHDAPGSCGYTLTAEDGEKFAVCTDLGEATEEIYEALRGCKTLLLESNHDENVLMAGPYPYYLKQRILGQFGHLSNDSCGKLAVRLLRCGAQNIVLGHLSKQNNFPDIAYETVNYRLEECGAVEGDYRLRVASPVIADRHYEVSR